MGGDGHRPSGSSSHRGAGAHALSCPMRWMIPVLMSLGAPVAADAALDRLIAETREAFPRVPDVQLVDEIGPVCGGGATAGAVYCTSDNTIYLTDTEGDDALYTLAHLYGHGLQVRYGVADLALNAIRSQPGREVELRGMVTRQVECLAGLLIARAGLPVPDLGALFATEPMADAHWGRRPVRTGPEVAIGLDARAEWVAIGGAAQTAAACTVGEMPADLIAEADRG